MAEYPNDHGGVFRRQSPVRVGGAGGVTVKLGQRFQPGSSGILKLVDSDKADARLRGAAALRDGSREWVERRLGRSRVARQDDGGTAWTAESRRCWR